MSHGIKLTLFAFLAFAIVRISGATNVFFKDAAHIYTGGLFGAAIVLWSIPALLRQRCVATLQIRMGFTESQALAILTIVEDNLHVRAKLYLHLGIVISLIELSVAILSRVLV